MTKSQNLKFNAIENTDAIVGIDIAKNVHWAGIILPNGKEIKKSFSFNNNKKGFETYLFRKVSIRLSRFNNYL